MGAQCRSVIFHHSPEQKRVTEEIIRWLEERGVCENVVTRVEPFEAFYPAEGYHVNYYENNRGQPNCALVLAQKIGELRRTFEERIK